MDSQNCFCWLINWGSRSKWACFHFRWLIFCHCSNRSVVSSLCRILWRLSSPLFCFSQRCKLKSRCSTTATCLRWPALRWKSTATRPCWRRAGLAAMASWGSASCTAREHGSSSRPPNKTTSPTRCPGTRVASPVSQENWFWWLCLHLRCYINIHSGS